MMVLEPSPLRISSSPFLVFVMTSLDYNIFVFTSYSRWLHRSLKVLKESKWIEIFVIAMIVEGIDLF
jgi:hypothetical protein